MDYIPDPIESIESHIEHMIEEYEFDGDMMNCAGCGLRFDLVDLYPTSGMPHAAFMCESCMCSRGQMFPPPPE